MGFSSSYCFLSTPSSSAIPSKVLPSPVAVQVRADGGGEPKKKKKNIRLTMPTFYKDIFKLPHDPSSFVQWPEGGPLSRLGQHVVGFRAAVEQNQGIFL